MLITEFETLTGIYPDANLYRVIEHEYNTGDWENKAQFCDAYKSNEDGLASRLQSAANQRLIDTEEELSRMRHELRRSPVPALPGKLALEAAAFRAQQRMLYDEYESADVGIAAVALDFLAKEVDDDAT